jgi:hypothetical protein
MNLRMTDLFVVAKKDLLKRRVSASLKGHLLLLTARSSRLRHKGTFLKAIP